MQDLPYVSPGQSVIAGRVRALHLDRRAAHGPREAFAPDGGTEFAHLHGVRDGSLHLTLPPATARAAIAAGWAEFHPVVLAGLSDISLVMIYGPRDSDELETVFRFVELSHAYATGSLKA